MPKYSLEEIKLGIDRGTWERAVRLYKEGAVRSFRKVGRFYQAKVKGTHLYQVIVDSQEFDRGSCDCYLGQRDILCKHMIAVAIYALKGGQPLQPAERKFVEGLTLSQEANELSHEEMIAVRSEIRQAMRDIRAYTGPSRIWFAYQNRLIRGCRRLSLIFSRLPTNLTTAKLMINVLLRLDRKLSQGGVDDSDGTVGGFISDVVQALAKRAKKQPEIVPAFKPLLNRPTSFGWEEELVKMLARRKIQHKLA